MEKIDKLESKGLHTHMNYNPKELISFHYINNNFILNYRYNNTIFKKCLEDHLINKKYSYFILMIKMLSTWRQYARNESKQKARQRRRLRKASVEA